MNKAWPCLLLLLLAVPAALADDKTIRDEASNFEIAPPPDAADDWDVLKPPADRPEIKAHYKTEFADSDPPAYGEVQVIVTPLTTVYAARDLDYIVAKWAEIMEGAIENPRELTEGKTTLGGEEAYYRDVKGDFGSGIAHITWYLTRMGKNIYVLYVLRTYRAVGNMELEDEIGQIRDSFKFLKKEAVKADPKVKKPRGPGGPAGAGSPGKEAEPDPSLLEREKMKLDFWRIEMVKPEGLLNVPPEEFNDSEKQNNVVAKFQRDKEQTRLVIRVYAQSDVAQRYTIEQLAENYVKYFEKRFPEKSRLKPEIDKDYKRFPLAKDAIKMKLMGRSTVPETTYWYLAQCKNDRQYQLEIYFSGGEIAEKAWDPQIKDFLKNFKPLKD